jgi:hypothetical protein
MWFLYDDMRISMTLILRCRGGERWSSAVRRVPDVQAGLCMCIALLPHASGIIMRWVSGTARHDPLQLSQVGAGQGRGMRLQQTGTDASGKREPGYSDDVVFAIFERLGSARLSPPRCSCPSARVLLCFLFPPQRRPHPSWTAILRRLASSFLEPRPSLRSSPLDHPRAVVFVCGLLDACLTPFSSRWHLLS